MGDGGRALFLLSYDRYGYCPIGRPRPVGGDGGWALFLLSSTYKYRGISKRVYSSLLSIPTHHWTQLSRSTMEGLTSGQDPIYISDSDLDTSFERPSDSTNVSHVLFFVLKKTFTG